MYQKITIIARIISKTKIIRGKKRKGEKLVWAKRDDALRH